MPAKGATIYSMAAPFIYYFNMLGSNSLAGITR